MKKKLVFRCMLGAVIGLFISHCILLIISARIGDGAFHAVVPALAERCGCELAAVVWQTVGSLFYGAAMAGGSVVWEMEHWSILKKTIVHLLVTSLSTLLIAYLLHWVPHTFKGMALYFLLFIAIYTFIWLGQYLSTRKNLQLINKKL